LTANGFAQSQGDMNQDANDKYKKADLELSTIYKRILVEYKEDTGFINNLKVSERIWISFRDAELKVKYPNSDTRWYGSVFPMCAAIYLEQLTRDRINNLKIWIEGIEEGDVCIGSVHMKSGQKK
jgi:uncharacterized protein YecT (DUF1311 family)